MSGDAPDRRVGAACSAPPPAAAAPSRTAAAPEQRTRQAVGGDLLRQPQVRHDREVLAHEEPRVVRERAERLEPRGLGARPAARRPSSPPGRRDGSPATRRATGPPPRVAESGASSAHAISVPSTSQTTNRFAWRSQIRRVDRGSRCPSLRCVLISACSAAASAAVACRMMNPDISFPASFSRRT